MSEPLPPNPSPPLHLVPPNPGPSEPALLLRLQIAESRIRALTEQLEGTTTTPASASSPPGATSTPPFEPSSPPPSPRRPDSPPVESSESWPPSEPSSPSSRPRRPSEPSSASLPGFEPSSPAPSPTSKSSSGPGQSMPSRQDPVVTALLTMVTQLTAHRPTPQAGLSRADRELLQQLQTDVQALQTSPRRSKSISELFSTTPGLHEVLESHRLDILAAIRTLPTAPAPPLPSLVPVVRTAVLTATTTTVFWLVSLVGLFVFLVTRGML